VLAQQQSAGKNALSRVSSTSYSDTSGTFSSHDRSTSLNIDESLALSEGVYTDVYVVNWAPTTSEDWMSYVPPEQMALTGDGGGYVVIYDFAIIEPDMALDSASVG
jgi:hypothetical protein